jgi:hypothetical protein
MVFGILFVFLIGGITGSAINETTPSVEKFTQEYVLKSPHNPNNE